MSLLKKPSDMTRRQIESDDGGRIQVVANASDTVDIRRRIARARVKQPKIEVHRGVLPSHRTALLPTIASPGSFL